MPCWRCGEQVVNGICTMCGCPENTRKPATTESGKKLRYVYDKFGAKRTLTEDNLLIRCLPDILPDEIELRLALAAVMRVGAGRECYAVLENRQLITDASFDGVRLVLRSSGLSEKEGEEVLEALRDMIGCGTSNSNADDDPVPPRPTPQPPVPPIPSIDEKPKENLQKAREVSQKRPTRQPYHVLATLYNIEMEDATRGLAYHLKHRRGVLFLRVDGLAMHYYEHQIGLGKERKYHESPDIFIPIEAVESVKAHESVLSYDFTLVLRDGVRFMVLASTYAYNRKDVDAFVDALHEHLRQQ